MLCNSIAAAATETFQCGLILRFKDTKDQITVQCGYLPILNLDPPGWFSYLSADQVVKNLKLGPHVLLPFALPLTTQ
jgi:hypothetical protein